MLDKEADKLARIRANENRTENPELEKEAQNERQMTQEECEARVKTLGNKAVDEAENRDLTEEERTVLRDYELSKEQTPEEIQANFETVMAKTKAAEAAEAQGDTEKSSIQGAMENALNSALASGAASSSYLKTYPITPKMYERLINEFTYHPPFPNQIPRYKALRAMAQTFAVMVVELTPPSREQSLALMKIGEAMMHAHGAIARNEKPDEVPEEVPE